MSFCSKKKKIAVSDTVSPLLLNAIGHLSPQLLLMGPRKQDLVLQYKGQLAYIIKCNLILYSN